jgi:N-acetylglucosamine-6-phosphate deacetylase
MLGLNKGKIEAGYDADIILLDKDLNVAKTFVAGKEIN